jgi:hypothetical protein
MKLVNDRLGQKKFYSTLMKMTRTQIENLLIKVDLVYNVPFLIEFCRNLYINIYYHLNGDQRDQYNLGLFLSALNTTGTENVELVKRMNKFTRFKPINLKTLEILTVFSTLYNTDAVNILPNSWILLQLSHEINNYGLYFK